MSARSKLDKQNILNAIDQLASRIEMMKKHIDYVADDLQIIRKYIDEKDWILRKPRNKTESNDEEGK